MVSKVLLTVEKNDPIARDVYEMVLAGDVSAITNPGQFIDIRLESRYLRRPISVCHCTEGKVTIIYKVVGGGTEIMSTLEKGTVLDVLTGLGNGFDRSKSGEKPLLIGGGLGVAPMYWLCETLIREGKHPTVVMGYDTKDSVYYAEKFEALGAKVLVATMDGTQGTQGTVLDAIGATEKDYTFFYTCGPTPMTKAIHKSLSLDGQYSLEERMGCGFGACMGCSIQTKSGNKRVCKEGPVFDKEDMLF